MIIILSLARTQSLGFMMPTWALDSTLCMGPRDRFQVVPPASQNHTTLSSAGYYTQISTLADAQENVMEYLHVLSRPMVINHDHDIIWTEAYMDSKVGA